MSITSMLEVGKLDNLDTPSCLHLAASRAHKQCALLMKCTDVCSYASEIGGLLLKSKIGSICSSLCSSVVLVSSVRFNISYFKSRTVDLSWYSGNDRYMISACGSMQLWYSKGCGEKWVGDFEEWTSLEESILLFVGWGTYFNLSSIWDVYCM